MNKQIVIGKYTLESLTMGMYSNAMVIYREYIQNSVDAINQAISNGLINNNEGKIEITVDKDNSKIIIEDNGIAVSKDQVLNTLLDIGNSQKNIENSNGFRGIGRLAGLSYCEHLKFVTSYEGEAKKSIVNFDSSKLNNYMKPGEYNDYDLISVIKEITNYKFIEEKADTHYFKVILEGVENYDYILDYKKVREYLSQTAPVPYDHVVFGFANKIKHKFKEMGIDIPEYKIFISNKEEKELVHKNFCDSFSSNRSKKVNDTIKDIGYKFIKDKNEKIIAGLWYAKSNYYGTIVNNNIKGIRLRKGNFQIGDRFVLTSMFKEDRFSGWFQGEVHVINKKFIPNSRRDDFEKNKIYYYLIDQLSEVGNKLSKEIREVSQKRNKIKKDKDIFEDIDILTGRKPIDFDYKILALNKQIAKQEKKTINKIFKILDSDPDLNENQTKKIINKILINY